MKLAVGEKIALLRKEKDITQTELAEYLFLTPQTVSRWEAGGGDPDIALLPKIAAFFGVSIDELFGLSSLERTKDLVAKYSVLRDDRSFQEAMESIDSQIQTIDAFMSNGDGDSSELKSERDQLEAEKLHMWLQQGREDFQRALAIADNFVAKTEGNPKHPWYLRMRLQRDQLCCNTGRGRAVLAERRKDFAEHPSVISLLRYLSMLNHLQNYELVLSTIESKDSIREIIFPASKMNLSIWQEALYAAAETNATDFLEQHLPMILEICGKQEEFDCLMRLLNVYEGEKLAAIKQRLLALLPEVIPNEYFEENFRKKIEE